VTLAAHWASVSPESAGQWALAISDTELRDTTLASFASSLALDHPSSALDWTNSISNIEKQSETRLDIYDTWLDEDLSAGRAALIAQLQNVPDATNRQDFYALLHEKDPVFRAELYNLIEPSELETTNPVQEAPRADSNSIKRPTQPEPEVRKAIPVLEDPLEVEELAK